MNDRNRILLGGLAGLCACLASLTMSGQTRASQTKSSAASPAAPAKAGNPPRTPWGDPDLQGTWFVLYDVPLERSAANAGKEFLTDAEVEEADRKKGLRSEERRVGKE